jgi:hypothetical protein
VDVKSDDSMFNPRSDCKYSSDGGLNEEEEEENNKEEKIEEENNVDQN